jgi:hypothetical protein
MTFSDRIAECNAHDLRGFRPFVIDDVQVGWVRHGFAARLAAFGTVFVVDEQAVRLASVLRTPDDRTRAVADVVRALADEGAITGWRDEAYPVATRFGRPELMRIERAAVAHFGVRAYGVHMNGVVRRGDGLHLWIGRRAKDKPVAPGKLDNLVAGGQPAGLSLIENLIKECEEEASIPAALARQAVSVSAVTYCLEHPEGLKPDVLFCYDLAVPEDFTPRNRDGEIAEFTLMPVDEVARLVRDTHEFKFNVNLVIVDFLIRHGAIPPEHLEFLDLVKRLRS